MSRPDGDGDGEYRACAGCDSPCGCPLTSPAAPAADRPDGDGGNVITCTHDGLAEHLWEPPRCPVAIPWAVRPAAPAAEADLRTDLLIALNTVAGPEATARAVDAVLVLPALQRLVEQAADAARLRETVARVEAVPAVGTLRGTPVVTLADLNRALDGTDG